MPGAKPAGRSPPRVSSLAPALVFLSVYLAVLGLLATANIATIACLR